MATERTERVVTVDRLAEQLAAVERAAAKLAAGSHGRCDACGGEIGADRLAALPAAALCLTCKKNRRAGGNRASASTSTSTAAPGLLDQPLAELDPEVAAALRSELRRQQDTLEMIASETFVPRAVLECQGSVLTNKYAEGYPGRRYYGGCECVDVVEQLAIDRARELFGAEHANVQPHSGAQANAAAMAALLQPGDTILGAGVGARRPSHPRHADQLLRPALRRGTVSGGPGNQPGGHGSGRPAGPGAPAQTDHRRLARLPAAARLRSVPPDRGRGRRLPDGGHGPLRRAGRGRAAPLAGAVRRRGDSTVHKTLGGPRGGFILCRQELAKKIDSAVFPGQQGGPLEHVIAAKAVTFLIAAGPEFAERQRRTLDGAARLAERLTRAGAGVRVLTGGTDVHLVLVDLRESELDGVGAERRLHEVGITVNRNAVPFDPRPPAISSGLRIGTPALATRGFTAPDFAEVADIVAAALVPGHDPAALRERVRALTAAYPLYPGCERRAVVSLNPYLQGVSS